MLECAVGQTGKGILAGLKPALPLSVWLIPRTLTYLKRGRPMTEDDSLLTQIQAWDDLAIESKALPQLNELSQQQQRVFTAAPCPHFITELQISRSLPHITLFIHGSIVPTVLLYGWTFTQSRVFSHLLSCLVELNSVSKSSVFAPPSPSDSQGSWSNHKFY